MRLALCGLFFFSSRRRHTRLQGDWSSDVCSSDLRGETAQELQRDGPEHPDERIPQREPEGLVTQQARVVPEPDEPVLLRLDEHVVEEAHVHGLQDRDDDRAAESDGDRNQVEVARHELPGPPGGEGARERDGDRGVRGRHQVMFFASTSANLSRNSRAVSLPTSACWKSGTPAESSLPPHPAWARYGLTIENGKDRMKPA